ncbi:hypothetical protein CW740_00205 [Kangiella profundi]|uniref:Uncharacterized protein n=1 Tax=Kangiella profundi TaxID=1561924 RepID=A0A2K9AUZ5_9GAMM|nr:hypothetical protein [Kangiella profundi]AUD77739.1 hypothetical protein CW740_00205 [Kangiella profundi]GGE93050.1 hypothetical protein GCM10011356_03880 [Kangiella profundi]
MKYFLTFIFCFFALQVSATQLDDRIPGKTAVNNSELFKKIVISKLHSWYKNEGVSCETLGVAITKIINGEVVFNEAGELSSGQSKELWAVKGCGRIDTFEVSFDASLVGNDQVKLNHK